MIVCATIGSQACASINAFIATVLDVRVDPSEFVGSADARESFFQRNPAADMQGLQLESIYDYYLDLPPEIAIPLKDDLTAAIVSFAAVGVSAEFTPMPPGILGSIASKMKNWVSNNQDILNTNKKKKDQVNILSSASQELGRKLRGI
jgi:hypothetical protein